MICPRCKREKDESEFYDNHKLCIRCTNYQRDYYQIKGRVGRMTSKEWGEELSKRWTKIKNEATRRQKISKSKHIVNLNKKFSEHKCIKCGIIVGEGELLCNYCVEEGVVVSVL